jgi:hypothetical protein
MPRPCARRQDHEGKTATAESKVVLHRSAGTAGASHSAPDRCAAASSGASPAIPGNRRSPRVTASSAARQSPAGVPDGAAGRAASRPDTVGSRPASRSRNTAAREVNRDRHDRAVDAGTLRRTPPPGPRRERPRRNPARRRGLRRQHQHRLDHRRPVPAP